MRALVSPACCLSTVGLFLGEREHSFLFYFFAAAGRDGGRAGKFVSILLQLLGLFGRLPFQFAVDQVNGVKKS